MCHHGVKNVIKVSVSFSTHGTIKGVHYGMVEWVKCCMYFEIVLTCDENKMRMGPCVFPEIRHMWHPIHQWKATRTELLVGERPHHS